MKITLIITILMFSFQSWASYKPLPRAAGLYSYTPKYKRYAKAAVVNNLIALGLKIRDTQKGKSGRIPDLGVGPMSKNGGGTVLAYVKNGKNIYHQEHKKGKDTDFRPYKRGTFINALKGPTTIDGNYSPLRVTWMLNLADKQTTIYNCLFNDKKIKPTIPLHTSSGHHNHLHCRHR